MWAHTCRSTATPDRKPTSSGSWDPRQRERHKWVAAANLCFDEIGLSRGRSAPSPACVPLAWRGSVFQCVIALPGLDPGIDPGNPDARSVMTCSYDQSSDEVRGGR